MLIARFKKALISCSLGALIVSSLLGVANASVQEVKVKDYFGEQTIKLPDLKDYFGEQTIKLPDLKDYFGEQTINNPWLTLQCKKSKSRIISGSKP